MNCLMKDMISLFLQEHRMDLIAFDSPFPADQSEDETEFEDLWNSNESSDARGWHQGSIDTVVRGMQKMGFVHLKVIPADVEPYLGRR